MMPSSELRVRLMAARCRFKGQWLGARLRRELLRIVPLLIAGLALPLSAEVLESDDGRFVSAHEINVNASPTRVFDALKEEVGAWWDPAHTYSGDASNMTFDLEFLLLEAWEENVVWHMSVDVLQPPKLLRLSGGLGPLQPLAVAGSMTFEFEESESGTRLSYRYVVHGRGLREWAEPVDRVMGGQLQRLRRYVETGTPAAASDAN